jgi:hypothetical protein
MEPWVAILIGAVGTWIIAIFAVADRFKGLFLQPQFSGTTAAHSNGQRARYYFVNVENQRRYIASAHEVQAVLTRIQKSGAAGPETIFDEVMPLPWQRQELQPLLTRTLGTSSLAGVFYVQQDGTLGITPVGGPERTVAAHFPREHIGPCTLWITLRALSIEADSPSIRLRINWSGQWHDGKAEIEGQCVVTVEPDPNP